MQTSTRASLDELTSTHLAGYALALAGVLLLVASLIFPSDFGADSYRELIGSVLGDGRWRPANVLFLLRMLSSTFALWTLLDSPRGREDTRVMALARAGAVAAALLSVGMACFVAAYSERALYVAGGATPLFELAETIDSVGWPIFGLALAGLALLLSREWRVTPVWAAWLAAAGGVAIGLAGLLGAGLHVLAGTYLNGLGLLLWAWFIWAGLRLARQ
jgi:hypothetical protein